VNDKEEAESSGKQPLQMGACFNRLT